MPSNHYRNEAQEILEFSRLQPIKILVWGPGIPEPSASIERKAAYGKRLKIRDNLRLIFPRAEVFFSEDPEMVELSAPLRGQLRREALQARIADLVIMLDISRGADLELDHFVPTYPWFRDKVYVFLPEEYVPPRGLVREVFAYLPEDQVEGYTQQEFEECTLATKKAMEIAQSVAVDLFLKNARL
jgi:hypothetical protein